MHGEQPAAGLHPSTDNPYSSRRDSGKSPPAGDCWHVLWRAAALLRCIHCLWICSGFGSRNACIPALPPALCLADAAFRSVADGCPPLKACALQQLLDAPCCLQALRSDVQWVAARSWDYCVLDEGHMIRSPKSKVAQVGPYRFSNLRGMTEGTLLVAPDYSQLRWGRKCDIWVQSHPAPSLGWRHWACLGPAQHRGVGFCRRQDNSSAVTGAVQLLQGMQEGTAGATLSCPLAR